MITAKEALAIGKTIVAGMGRETARHPAGSREWLAARGAALNSIEDLWYDVLPLKVRETIGSRDYFLVGCGWE